MRIALDAVDCTGDARASILWAHDARDGKAAVAALSHPRTTRSTNRGMRVPARPLLQHDYRPLTN
jgi:hypothetical protein